MRKLILAIVAAVALTTSAAWAGHRVCTTHCEGYGYCYTSCYDY